MQNFLVVSIALPLGLAFLAAIMTLTQHTKIRRYIWSIIGIIAFIVGSAAAVTWVQTEPDRSLGMVWAVFILIGVGAIFWVVLITTNKVTAAGGHNLAERLGFSREVALPGWQNLDTTHLREEDRREAGRVGFVINIGAALIILPGITGLLIASIAMNIRGSEQSDFLSHAIGFYILLIATCWTVCYILTIALVSLVQVVRGNGRELTLAAVANSLGTWAGLGAAGGVFVGALIPLVVVPLARGEWEKLGVSLLDAISPTLLLDISAAGAVFGFLVGEIVSLVSISEGEQNLYLKACAPPIVFAGVASALGALGLTPGKLAHELANEYKATVLKGVNTDVTDPFKTASDQGLDSEQGWAAAVAGMDQHGWNTLVDHNVYYVSTWIIAILVALFAFVLGIRNREAKLLEQALGPVGDDSGRGRPAAAGTGAATQPGTIHASATQRATGGGDGTGKLPAAGQPSGRNDHPDGGTGTSAVEDGVEGDHGTVDPAVPKTD